MAHAERTRLSAPADTPIASLDVADIRRDLKVRPRRASARSRTHRAFSLLASEMAANARRIRQEVCGHGLRSARGIGSEWMRH